MIVHSPKVVARGVVPGPRADVEVSSSPVSLAGSARLVRCLLPDFDQVSVIVVDDAGTVSTLARAGDLVAELDQLQATLGEGPSIDCVRDDRPVLASHIRHAGHWRRYSAAAVALGVRSQVAAPLPQRQGRPVGALTMYSTTHTEIDITAPVVAGVVATQVGDALRDSRDIADLHGSLSGSAIIAQATWLVMALLGTDADGALAHLHRISAHQGGRGG